MNSRNLTKAVLLLVSSYVVAACGNAPTQQPQQIQEYETLAVTTSDKELLTTYSATIRGQQDVDIYPLVSGSITRLCINEGEAVRKGQLLFVIDQVPYLAALRTAEANVEAAKASVATAQLVYESKQALFKENVISEFELNTAYNNLLTAKAQLAQADAQRVNAANNLSYTEVKSPVNGVVGVLPYRVGALVSPSMPKPLTSVSDNSSMFVYFSMGENQVLDLTRRFGSKDKALAEMPAVELILNDKSLYELPGKVEAISGVIDRNTGTVTLRANFPNPNGLLHSGASGNVVIPVEAKNASVIPRTATFEIQDKVFVYTIVDGIAKSLPVTVTRATDGNEYIVTSGLTPGDVIVTEGVGILREGTPIRAKGASAAAN